MGSGNDYRHIYTLKVGDVILVPKCILAEAKPAFFQIIGVQTADCNGGFSTLLYAADCECNLVQGVHLENWEWVAHLNDKPEYREKLWNYDPEAFGEYRKVN